MDLTLIFPVLIIVVFYFFIILPQTKKQKQQKQYLLDLQKGDQVVTSGGIHGKIVELKELTVVIDTGGGNKLKLNRGALNMEASELEKSNSKEN